MYEIALSHARPRTKTAVLSALIDGISERHLVDEFVEELQELANIQQKGCIEAVLRARQQLMRFQLPSFKQRQVAVERFMRDTVQIDNEEERVRRFNVLADQVSLLLLFQKKMESIYYGFCCHFVFFHFFLKKKLI